MSADCKHAIAALDSSVSGRSKSAVVIDFCAARLERLAEQIVVQMSCHGGAVTRCVTVDLGDVGDVAVERSARRAGRALNVPVRTGVAPDGSKVWVVAES